MTTNVQPLHERQERVLQKIRRQRLELMMQAQGLQRALSPFDKVQQGVSHFTDHPLMWLVSAGLIVFSVGPNRMARIFLSAWNLWQVFRFFKKRNMEPH